MASKLTLALAAFAALMTATTGQAQQRTLVINSDTSDPAPKKAMQELIYGFKAENPDVAVEWNIFDHEGYKTSIRNFLTADAPDIAAWYAGNRMEPYVDAGLFEPIDQLWADNKLDDQLKSAASSMTRDGKKWGIPYSTYQWGLYVRSDILKENGIGELKTLDDLVAACGTLRAKNITPIAFGSKAFWPAAGWFDYLDLRTNGFEFHNQLTNGEIPYTDPRVKAVFENWKKLLDAKCFLDNHAAIDWQDAVPGFVQGTSAIFLIGNFGVAPMKEGGLKEDQIDFVRFPVITEGLPLAEDAPTETMHIPAKAKNKEDAMKFLAYLARPDTQTKMNTTLGQLPVNNQSTVPDDKFLKIGFEMLSGAAGLAQFYDRDAKAEMAKAGMEGFQEFMVKPDQIDRILERLEKVRKRAYR